MRGKSLISMLIIPMLIVSLAMVNVGHSPLPPRVYVDPDESVYNPTEHFNISIKVENSPEIVAYEFKLKWDESILEFPTEVMEEPFVNDTGPTDFIVLPNSLYVYMLVSCYLKQNVTNPPDGNGTLATVEFYVLAAGVTNITLYDVKLYDYATGGVVPDVTMDSGYFYTTRPYPDFTWTPEPPEANETATFNANASFDPDGGTIKNYTWDFGDGTSIVTTNETIITHNYTDYRYDPYIVNLTVTDDENETSFITKPLRMWHEIVTADKWPSIYVDVPWWWFDTVDSKAIRGQWLWILIACTNLGSYVDAFNVSLYADLDTSVIGDELVLPWLWFDPETMPPEWEYTVPMELGPVKGSGWDLIFHWPTDEASAGKWTITAVATVVPGEVVTANNNLTFTITIPIYGELNLDGIVDILDLVTAANAFGTQPGDPDWNPLADFNNDGCIDIFDLVVIGINFGKKW